MEKVDKRERRDRAQVAAVTSGPCPANPRPDKWMTEELQNSMIQRVARLEAALTLTTGTLHDVNNVLTVLAGHLFLLTETARDQPKLYEQARRARNVAERGSTLLRELLTFDREPDDETQIISPGNHVLALKPLLSRTIGAEHEFTVSIDRNAGSVVASAAQFESALINLVINARDALKPQGEVRIRVSNKTLDESSAEPLALTPGDYVRIQVADNGSGIPAHYLERVTEPLFSTKPRDRGSGLGLSVVKRFAENANGGLDIDSVEDQGTRVSVWLPRSEMLAGTTANMTLPLSTLPGGDERLLLFSRDRDVRTSMQQILETLGYTVLAAESAEQVDRLLTQTPTPVLLISERSVAANKIEWRWLNSLRDTYGELRHIALLQAGTRAEDVATDADGHLFRPVTVQELAQTVRNALEV